MRILKQKFAEGFNIASGCDTVPLQLVEGLRYKEEIERIRLIGGLNLYTDEGPWDWCGYTGSDITKDKAVNKTFGNLEDLNNYLNSGKYDIIHSHTRGKKLNEINKEFHRRAIPIVYTMHGMDSLSNPLDEEMFDEVDLITAPSKYAADKITEKNKKYAKKTLAVPNSTNFTNYTYDPKVNELSEEIRKKYAPNGEELILITGRLQEDKGVYELGEAVLNLIEKGDNLKLMHTGIIFNEEDKIQLENIFEEKGYRDRLILNGKIPEGDEKSLAAIYKSADVFVLPSDGTYETFGLSALEALAMETPLITSAKGGTYQIYIEPGFGIGVQPRNVGSIEKGISHVINNYEQEKERAKIARKIIDKIYNTDFVSDLWVKIYEKLREDLPIVPNIPDDNYTQATYKKLEDWLND